MTKICSRCGCEVDDSVNFCPDCRSQSFRGEITQAKTAVVMHEATQSDLVYKLFYWKTDGGYMLSKTKVTSVCVFLFFIACVITGAPAAGGIFLAVLFSALVYVLGYAIHSMLAGAGANSVLVKYNDYGLLTDLKHLLFYWQDKKTGGFVLSKTKICSHLIFLIVAVAAGMTPFTSFAVCVFAGLMVEVPAFVIGWGVHKLTNPMDDAKVIEKKAQKPKEVTQKRQKPKISVPFKSKSADPEAEALKREFETKERHVREVIAKRFEPPQLTYTRFISIVDKSAELFEREYDSLINLIDLGDADSPRIASEISERKGVLKSIIAKIDELTNELVLTMDDDDDHEVDGLIDDMENLIRSVRDYE